MLALLLGTLTGIITGLIPGIHANLIAASLFSAWQTRSAVEFILALAITHTIIDAIPTCILRASTDDTIAAMPASGKEAAKTMIAGSAAGLLTAIIAIPFLLPVLPKLYSFVRPATAPLLVIVLLTLVMKEATWKDRGMAAAIVALSGFLGLVVLGKEMHQPLLPMLSGLFGIPGLMSIGKGMTVKTRNKGLWKTSIMGVGASSMLLLLPGLGPGQAARLLLPLANNYVALVGGINTIDFSTSIVMAATTGNARNGALEMATKIIEPGMHMIGTIAVSGSLAIFASLLLLRYSDRLRAPSFKRGMILVIGMLALYFDSLFGILTLVTSTSIGIIAARKGLRSHCMACLIIPTISYFV